jgi:hypothetical protein
MVMRCIKNVRHSSELYLLILCLIMYIFIKYYDNSLNCLFSKLLEKFVDGL